MVISTVNPDMDPLAVSQILEYLHSRVNRTVEADARVLTSGRPLDSLGNFYSPTVFQAKDVDNAIREQHDLRTRIEHMDERFTGTGALYKRDRDGHGLHRPDGAVHPEVSFGAQNSGYGRELSRFTSTGLPA